jgi:hypothetical protein
MEWSSSSIDAIRRVFGESFSAADIAEPLASFDGGTPAADVLRVMSDEDWDVVGVRRRGAIAGYADRSRLAGTSCGENVASFEADCVVSSRASLAEVIVPRTQPDTSTSSSVASRRSP